MVWVQLVICLAIIILAGTRLAKYGDLIAEKTGVGRVWVGVVLLAAVTSLPELATGISSVTFVQEPDLTVGNVFGAGLINLAIIAAIDLIYTRGPALHYLGTGLVLSAVLSVVLIASAATFLFLAQNLLTIAIFGRIGVYSILLFGTFLVAQYMIFRFQTNKNEINNENTQTSSKGQDISLKRVITFFTLAALVTFGAGTWLAIIGDQIAETTGLETSFVGTLFLAICTTSPEIIVSLSAARMGSVEMAVGNVIGSNIFNIGVILFIDDLFYSAGPILQGVSMNHAITALFVILMSCTVIIGIIFRPQFWFRAWVGLDTTILTFIYIGAILTIFYLG
ncbi:MAG TPA: sodium:calcium antiporter [Dehalococcoidia bacterium]|nr:sodium:calcium antiporter [Dehalococcoidia bacterium]